MSVNNRAGQFKKDPIQFDWMYFQFNSTYIVNVLPCSQYLVQHLRSVKVWSVLFSDILILLIGINSKLECDVILV